MFRCFLASCLGTTSKWLFISHSITRPAFFKPSIAKLTDSHSCLTLNLSRCFPFHLSVFLIYQMTHHTSTSDISLSEAQELHAALRIADNLQIHTHFILTCSYTDKCVDRVLTGTHIWHLNVCVSSTTQLSQQSRKTCTLTHTCTAVGYLSCPTYSGQWW